MGDLIRLVLYRVIVQKYGRFDKYYPTLISASTTDEYPFRVPSADISVVSNATEGTKTYIQPIAVDDHIRLQVSIRYSTDQRIVWKDIFQGTIQSIDSAYGSTNVTKLHCVGYMDEVVWSAIQIDFSWGAGSDACDYLGTMIGLNYNRRLIWDPSYGTTGVIISEYEIKNNQTFVSDIISDMEKMSGYKYRAFAVPVYDNGNNISAVYLSWRPLSTTVTDKYKIIEGNSRYINSEFSSTIEELVTRYVVIGSSTSEPPILYTAVDSTQEARYGTRTKVDTFNWIKTNGRCQMTATGCLNDLKLPHLSGTATIIGTPEAKVGDLVYCNSPSQEISGTRINTNMTVYRVKHDISENGPYTTSIDLGRIYKTEYDYIGKIVKTVHNNKRNSVKC